MTIFCVKLQVFLIFYFACSWRNQELQAQRLDQPHRMQAAPQPEQKVPFHPYLLDTHHRINDYRIHTARRPINMAEHLIHMHTFAQMASLSQHHIQPEENRKFATKLLYQRVDSNVDISAFSQSVFISHEW